MSSSPLLIVSSPSTGKKLGDKIKTGKPVLLLFHANWCPHCVDYVGHPRTQSYPWSQVVSYIHETQPETTVCEVESDHMGYLPPGLPPVQGFPTLLLIQGNTHKEFNGDRNDKVAIAKFIQGGRSGGAASNSKKQAKPSAKQAKPSAKQAKPSAKPAKPSAKPAKPSAKPAKPSAKPAKPSAKQAKPLAKQAKPKTKKGT